MDQEGEMKKFFEQWIFSKDVNSGSFGSDILEREDISRGKFRRRKKKVPEEYRKTAPRKLPKRRRETGMVENERDRDLRRSINRELNNQSRKEMIRNTSRNRLRGNHGSSNTEELVMMKLPPAPKESILKSEEESGTTGRILLSGLYYLQSVVTDMNGCKSYIIKAYEEDEKPVEGEIVRVEHLSTKKRQTLELLELEEEEVEVEDHLSSSEEDDSSSGSPIFECPICFDEVSMDFCQSLTTCSHRFCKECLVTEIEGRISEKRFPIICPDPNCQEELLPHEFKKLLSHEFQEKYDQFSLDVLVEEKRNYSCCMTPGCRYKFCFDEFCDNFTFFKCKVCTLSYCMSCKVNWHEGLTCKEYKIKKREDKNDRMFESFAIGKNFKQCPSCRRWIEKNEGCDRMTCRCGVQFCYRCGDRDYRNCVCRRPRRQFVEQRREEIDNLRWFDEMLREEYPGNNNNNNNNLRNDNRNILVNIFQFDQDQHRNGNQRTTLQFRQNNGYHPNVANPFGNHLPQVYPRRIVRKSKNFSQNNNPFF